MPSRHLDRLGFALVAAFGVSVLIRPASQTVWALALAFISTQAGRVARNWSRRKAGQLEALNAKFETLTKTVEAQGSELDRVAKLAQVVANRTSKPGGH
jgi:enamine deaminase RidA (YjgF/YER057c/UK114 family)